MEVGYGYGSLTELTEVPGRYANVVPVPRVLWHGRTGLTEVPGTVNTRVNTHLKQICQETCLRLAVVAVLSVGQYGHTTTMQVRFWLCSGH